MSKQTPTKSLYNSEIPSDWRLPDFGEVFLFLKSFSFSREQLTNEKTDDEIRNIHYGDIHSTYENEILDLDIERRVPYLTDGLIKKENFQDEDFPALQDGDLIIADASEDYEGVCNCVELKNVRNNKVVSGLHTFAARAENENISLGFRTYVLKHQQVIKELRRIATGTSVYGVSKTNLAKVKIALPPMPEQKAIAQVLTTWDEAITKTQTLINQKELSKKWLMQNLLTGKKRLKGFGGEWKEIKIHQLFKPENRYVAWDEDELYNLISIRRRNGGAFFREPLFGYQIGVKKLKEVIENDFVISKRQVSHGAWAVIDSLFNHAKVSDEYNCLVIKDNVMLTPEFWKWYCQLPILTHYANIDSDGVHIEKSIFDFNLFKRRDVIIPISIEEQTAIAQVLQAADKEINLLKAKAEKLREQKKGLMQMLLTGKQRLNISKK